MAEGKIRAAHRPVVQYLKEAAFSGFSSRTPLHRLTLNKCCRFFDVTVSGLGIRTRGHLWKLGKVIDTRSWPIQGARVDLRDGGLKVIQRRRLAHLVKWLKRNNYQGISENIRRYLNNDAKHKGVPRSKLSFKDRYMGIMAEEIADAIERGGLLILGCLWDPDNSTPYMAIFAWDDEMAGSERRIGCNRDRIFAFTASRSEDVGSEGFDLNDLDRHVSFEVGVVNQNNPVPPKLRIRRWLSGLCFFDGKPREGVVFPWPKDLEMIRP